MNTLFTSLATAVERALIRSFRAAKNSFRHSSLVLTQKTLPKTVRVLAMAYLVTMLSANGAVGQEFHRNIMTGDSQGTYFQIGRDLATISAGCGPVLNINESAGSLENLVAISKNRHTQFGIIQNDVLEYVRTYSKNDPDLQHSVSGLRVMFPLYNEEIQILASRNISRISDLSSKKVAIGEADSGTFLTASLVLDILQINDATRISVSPAEALPKLISGEIDALFYVAGAPTKLFSDAAIDGAKFHLLDITEPELLATYTPIDIPAHTYPFQTDPVNVVSVRAMLMTYAYEHGNDLYSRQSCKAVSDLSSVILTNLERLKTIGHPKWRELDLSQLPPGWKVSGCAKTGMNVSYELSCDSEISAIIDSVKSSIPKQTLAMSDVPKVRSTVKSNSSLGSVEVYYDSLKTRDKR